VTDIQARVREPESDGGGALVLIHGRGADENDLFPLFDMLDPERRLLGVCPRGPLSLPPGGAHWYAVYRVGFPDPETFFPTYTRLAGWLDGFLAERGITHDNTVIGGFSQGAVMSYALSLGPDRPRPAGTIALSGFVPTVEGFDLQLNDLGGYPVAIGHGTHDPIITVDFGRDAKARLEGAGADVTWRESPMPHTIDPNYIDDLVPWLKARLS
jgi:phospholipase/carboxylesterase